MSSTNCTYSISVNTFSNGSALAGPMVTVPASSVTALAVEHQVVHVVVDDHQPVAGGDLGAAVDVHHHAQSEAAAGVVVELVGDANADQVGAAAGLDQGPLDGDVAAADHDLVVLGDAIDRMRQADVGLKPEEILDHVDHVVAGRALDEDRVEVGTAVEVVVARAADHRVLAGAAVERVVAGAALEEVVAGPAVQSVASAER